MATTKPVQDGEYLTADEKLVVVENGKPARAYDVGGLGWLFKLMDDPNSIRPTPTRKAAK